MPQRPTTGFLRRLTLRHLFVPPDSFRSFVRLFSDLLSFVRPLTPRRFLGKSSCTILDILDILDPRTVCSPAAPKALDSDVGSSHWPALLTAEVVTDNSAGLTHCGRHILSRARKQVLVPTLTRIGSHRLNPNQPSSLVVGPPCSRRSCLGPPETKQRMCAVLDLSALPIPS